MHCAQWLKTPEMEAKHGFRKARPDPIQHAFVKKLPKTQHKLCAQEGHTIQIPKRQPTLPEISHHYRSLAIPPPSNGFSTRPDDEQVSPWIGPLTAEIFWDGLLPFHVLQTGGAVWLFWEVQLRGFPWSRTTFCIHSTNSQAERDWSFWCGVFLMPQQS